MRNALLILLEIGLVVAVLVYAVSQGIYIGYPLLGSLLLFSYTATRLGHSPRQVGRMLLGGAKKSLPVIRILLYIGAITAVWMASGTVAALVHRSIGWVTPSMFVLWAFWISLGMSYLLGTAFGTTGTVGVILIVLARSGGVNEYLTAGAILSGAYFGDRCSPMSSALNLLCTLTGQKLYEQVKAMVKSSLPAVAAATVLYWFLAHRNPLDTGASSGLLRPIEESFSLGFGAYLPALVILVLCLLKINVRHAMAASILCGAAVAVLQQGMSLPALARAVAVGFSFPAGHPLASIIQGGGLWPMAKNVLVILIACAIAGVFEQSGMLNGLNTFLMGATTRAGLFGRTAFLGFVTGACGCNQTIAIVMTAEMMQPPYEKAGVSRAQLAQDVSATAFLLSPLIPWNISVTIPTTALSITGLGYMPYLFFIYLLPVFFALYYLLPSHRALPARSPQP